MTSDKRMWTGQGMQGLWGILLLLFSAQADAQASYRIEETEITLDGEWISEGNSQYSEGNAALANFTSHDPGASATFEFDGTGITWIGARTFNAGLFDWIIDEGLADERRGTVNTYIDGVERFSTEVLATDLSPGTHTFKFISLGIHGASMVSTFPSETYIDAFEISTEPEAPTVTVVAASSTYPAGTDNDGFVSMTDDPLGPFSGQSVTFHGLDVGGVPQVYRFRIDYDEVVTLGSVIVEGAGWTRGSITLMDEMENPIVSIDDTSPGGCCDFYRWELDGSGVSGRTFFLEEFNEDGNYRYRSNITFNPTGGAGSTATEVTIRAHIDGVSRINIQDNELWWHHIGAAAPGVHLGANDPTIVNGYDWFPSWPFVGEGRDCDCESDRLDLAVTGTQLPDDAELLELRVLSSRETTTILQSPSIDNNFHTIIELDDGITGGSEWYEIVAVFGSGGIAVPGTSNPWLAGMPDGSTARGGDVAPDQSPVLAPIAITPGIAMTFSATGIASNGGGGGYSPDGDVGYQFHAAENGIADGNMPLAALAGVFLDTGQPDESPAPPILDFGAGGNVADGINYTAISPQLKQVFFIGDGQTDSGVSQQITPPAGATRLFLGIMDGSEFSNNSGEFEVEISAGSVPPVNQIPMAIDDGANADTGVSVVIDVLANDQGLGDTPIVVSITADPANGTAIVGADNNITYTSNVGFVGNDDFQYTATDRDGDASMATAAVNVVDPNVNSIPIANDDSANATTGGNVVIDVLANDTRLDDAPVVVTIETDPGRGEAFVLTDNRISYTAPDLTGNDTLQYKVTDRDGDESMAWVTIVVSAPAVDVPERRRNGGGVIGPFLLILLFGSLVVGRTAVRRSRYG